MLVLITALMLSAAPAPRSVLVLPLTAREGANADLTALLTSAMVNEAQKYEGYRITDYREVQTTLTVDQTRQISGCDTVSCAVEIAGALNADEIVMGELGKVGSSYVLTLSRVRARDSVVLARALGRYADLNQDAMLDGIPALTATLFASPSSLEPAPASAPADEKPRVLPGVLLASGGAFAGLGALALAAGLLTGAVVAAVFLVDLAGRGGLDNPNHVIPRELGMAANAGVYLAAVLVVLALPAILVGAGTAVASRVL